MTLNLLSLLPDHVYVKLTGYLRADEVNKLHTVVDESRTQMAFDNMRHFEILVEQEDIEFCCNQLLRCGSALDDDHELIDSNFHSIERKCDSCEWKRIWLVNDQFYLQLEKPHVI